jgi:phosphate butyryltransferase
MDLAGAAVIRNFEELRSRAREANASAASAGVGEEATSANFGRCGAPKAKRVAVVWAEDDVALTAAAGALACGIAIPQLLGEAGKVRAKAQAMGLEELLDVAEFVDVADAAEAVRTACRMAAAGESDILLKGRLRTDELLHGLLVRESGMRTGRLLSDVLLYEDDLSGERRLVGITDGGLNVLPTLDQKRQIVLNAIEVMQCIGIARPRIALMSATEAVTEAIPSTVDAAALTEMGARGEFGEARVFGPLALDNALLLSAAEAKGITNPVAGRADCLVVPNIEAGNLLGKAVNYLRHAQSGGTSQCAHVVVGARVPVLIPSRVESAEDKVNSMALGVLFQAYSMEKRKEARR